MSTLEYTKNYGRLGVRHIHRKPSDYNLGVLVFGKHFFHQKALGDSLPWACVQYIDDDKLYTFVGVGGCRHVRDWNCAESRVVYHRPIQKSGKQKPHNACRLDSVGGFDYRDCGDDMVHPRGLVYLVRIFGKLRVYDCDLAKERFGLPIAWIFVRGILDNLSRRGGQSYGSNLRRSNGFGDFGWDYDVHRNPASALPCP